MSIGNKALCAGLAGVLFAACGGDDKEPAGIPASDGGISSAPVTTDTGGVSGAGRDASVPSTGSGPRDAGPKPVKEDPCAVLPPHATKGESFFGECSYLCEVGYADCDGDIVNGCEVALSAPGACDQCHALACLQPEVCGLAEPACQTTDGPWTTISLGSDNNDNALDSLVPGKAAGDVIASGLAKPVAEKKLVWPAMYGTTFGFTVGGSAIPWAARGPAQSFISGSASVRRFGDRLYIIDSHETDEEKVPSAVLIVADLDGNVLWNKRIGDGIAKLCAHHVAADEQNNVYLAYGVCSASERSENYVLDGKKYDADDGDLLISFDAAGTQRWNTLLFPDDNLWVDDGGVCENGAETELIGLTAKNGRLFGINEVCLAEIDPASGAVKAAQKLYVEMDDYGKLVADAAGNLYVGGNSASSSVLLVPNAPPPAGSTTKHVGGNGAFVSKYGPDLKHVWSRALAVHGTYEGKAKVDPYYRDFDVTAAGTGLMLGSAGDYQSARAFVVGFDTDGKITSAAKLRKGDVMTALTLDAAGTPYVGGRTSVNGNAVYVQTLQLK